MSIVIKESTGESLSKEFLETHLTENLIQKFEEIGINHENWWRSFDTEHGEISIGLIGVEGGQTLESENPTTLAIVLEFPEGQIEQTIHFISNKTYRGMVNFADDGSDYPYPSGQPYPSLTNDNQGRGNVSIEEGFIRSLTQITQNAEVVDEAAHHQGSPRP